LNRQLDTLRAALQKAIEWHVIEPHPLRGLKRLKVDDAERVRFLTLAEENRLRDALTKRTDHLRPLVLLALNTGLRRGELFSLRWSDIDLHHALLTVRAAAAKSGMSRHVPFERRGAGRAPGLEAAGETFGCGGVRLPGHRRRATPQLSVSTTAVTTSRAGSFSGPWT
jgi:integrase